jgi:hypothetical protein
VSRFFNDKNYSKIKARSLRIVTYLDTLYKYKKEEKRTSLRYIFNMTNDEFDNLIKELNV